MRQPIPSWGGATALRRIGVGRDVRVTSTCAFDEPRSVTSVVPSFIHVKLRCRRWVPYGVAMMVATVGAGARGTAVFADTFALRSRSSTTMARWFDVERVVGDGD